MIKNKIKFCLLASLLALQLPTSTFAMENAGENQNHLAPRGPAAAIAALPVDAQPPAPAAPAIPQLPLPNAAPAHVPPMHNVAPAPAVVNDVQIITQAVARMNLRIQDLERTNTRLVASLNEADDLVRSFMSATPTARTFLHAFFKNEPRARLEELWQEATTQQVIPDIIVGVNKQVRGATPMASRKLVELSSLTPFVSADFPTVTYADARIPGSPLQGLQQCMLAINNLKNRGTAGQPAHQPAAAQLPLPGAAAALPVRRQLDFAHDAAENPAAAAPIAGQPAVKPTPKELAESEAKHFNEVLAKEQDERVIAVAVGQQAPTNMAVASTGAAAAATALPLLQNIPVKQEVAPQLPLPKNPAAAAPIAGQPAAIPVVNAQALAAAPAIPQPPLPKAEPAHAVAVHHEAWQNYDCTCEALEDQSVGDFADRAQARMNNEAIRMRNAACRAGQHRNFY